MEIKAYKKSVVVEISEDELLDLYQDTSKSLRILNYGSYAKSEDVVKFLINLRDNYLEKMMEGINNYG